MFLNINDMNLNDKVCCNYKQNRVYVKMIVSSTKESIKLMRLLFEKGNYLHLFTSIYNCLRNN